MAINLEKAPFETLYYYAENGKTVGPFPLKELLPRITADTLVYREGIEWTNAKDIEELKAHFTIVDPPKKPLLLKIIISVLFFALIGVGALIVYNQMNKQEPPFVDKPKPEDPGLQTTTEPTEPENTPTVISKSETSSSENDKGTDIGTDREVPSPTKTEKRQSSPKQAELFTCESGQNVRKTLVNNGACDCNDCSDESKN